MKTKTLIIIFAVIFLIGIVTATNTISNLVGIDIPSSMIAGDTVTANFSFDYLDILDNEDNSPLIIKMNLASEDQINYPVWKGDFKMSGFVEKCFYTIFGTCIFPSTVYFNCSETAPLIIEHSIGSHEIEYIENGTFYCYNKEADLNLNEKDKVFLNIKSHQALYPGQYNLTAELYYLNDTYPPIVNITNKNYFETTYFRELSDIEITATIDENVEVDNYWGTIFTTPEISIDNKHESMGIYYLSRLLPITIPEENFEMKVFAKDKSGNLGEDATILMIDRTAPNIHAIQPNGSYHEIIYIELNVTDEKAGVDNSSVEYRISEMIPGYGQCPEGGIGLGNLTCYDSGWLSTTYNSTTTHYHDEFNSSALPEGEYWFNAKAKDILGNEGEL